MNKKSTSKKDELLKQLYCYRETSAEATDVLDGSFYVEKVKKELMKEGYLKKASLKTTKKTALKAGVSFKTHSYYVTSKGKKYLHEKFPQEFSEEILETRKQSNDATERLVKISDSAIMSEIAGAYIINKDNLMEEDCLENLTGQIQYDDFGDVIGNPSPTGTLQSGNQNYTEKQLGTSNEDLKIAVKENIHRGIYFTANEAKKNLTLSKAEVSQYKFTAITGVLLTSAKPYCLYHAGNGFISQTSKGEEKVASNLIISYTKNFSLYPDEIMETRITNAIIFCKNVGAFAKLVLNKYKSKIAPGAIFENSYIIPVSRNGCNILKKFIEEPEYKNKLVNYLVTEYGFTRRKGYAVGSLPVENQNGEAVFIGVDFDINNLRTAIDVVVNDSESKYQKMVILCYGWQQDYYNEVISLLGTEKIVCQPIDEEALDEIVGFTNRIPTIKERKRRQPTYSRNSLLHRTGEEPPTGEKNKTESNEEVNDESEDESKREPVGNPERELNWETEKESIMGTPQKEMTEEEKAEKAFFNEDVF